MLEWITPARLPAAACALPAPLFVLGWLMRQNPAGGPPLVVRQRVSGVEMTRRLRRHPDAGN
jgi:hypothetical protein